MSVYMYFEVKCKQQKVTEYSKFKGEKKKMIRTRKTKIALISSVIALLVCVTLLVGTTFAWFTDSATSVGNKIQSGTLDVDIVDETGVSLVGEKLMFQNVNGDTDILWEPGATFRTQAFKIKNNGNLALKYRLALNGIDGDSVLLEVISFSIVKEDGTAVDLETFEGTLEENAELSDIYYIQGVMDIEAGNEYQDKELVGIGVTVIAGQAMHESDYFDDAYDANAKYPEPESNQPATPTYTVSTASQLQAAMQPTNSDGDLIVNLSGDFELAAGETWTPLGLDSYTGVARIVINGNGHTIKGLNNALISNAIFGNTKVEINDLTLVSSTVAINGDYAGAFVSYSDNAISITLNNCHLADSKVSSNDYSGGLVGYVAGPITIENCSVKNCEITGESVGSLVGMISVAQGGETATISKVNVTGNTLTSNKAGTYRVGEVIGTTNIENVVLTDITASGNTCSQPGSTGATSGMKSTKWIGRGSSNITGDTSDEIIF